MASTSGAQSGDVTDKPHQPLTFNYPKRTFGKRNVVSRSFQPGWYSQWPFLHYDEAKDVVYCHTCLLGFKLKRMKTNSADSAFVSGMQYQNMYKNIIDIFSIIATIII